MPYPSTTVRSLAKSKMLAAGLEKISALSMFLLFDCEASHSEIRCTGSLFRIYGA